MENNKHTKDAKTLVNPSNSIRGYLSRKRCFGTRSRFDSSRRYC